MELCGPVRQCCGTVSELLRTEWSAMVGEDSPPSRNWRLRVLSAPHMPSWGRARRGLACPGAACPGLACPAPETTAGAMIHCPRSHSRSPAVGLPAFGLLKERGSMIQHDTLPVWAKLCHKFVSSELRKLCCPHCMLRRPMRCGQVRRSQRRSCAPSDCTTPSSVPADQRACFGSGPLLLPSWHSGPPSR